MLNLVVNKVTNKHRWDKGVKMLKNEVPMKMLEYEREGIKY
jgi:hypothetical protein